MTWPPPNDTDEFDGMPAFPTLEVADIEASARWYRALGFRHVFTMPRPSGRPQLVHLRWARYADLLLRPGKATGGGSRGEGVTLSFAMFTRDGETVDDVAARAREIGVTILAEPADRPWNARGAAVADPDGYRLVFTEPVVADGSVTIEQVVERGGARRGRPGSERCRRRRIVREEVNGRAGSPGRPLASGSERAQRPPGRRREG